MKNKWILLLILLIVSIGIGGKIYMNEKDKKESLEIQKDLANYLSSGFNLYTKDYEVVKQIDKEFNKGNGTLSNTEYLEKLKTARKYLDITKVEFTGYTITPMDTVKIHFIINDVYKDEVVLDTLSFETNKPIYTISTNSGNGPIYIDKKKERSDNNNVDIKFYEGKIE